MSSPGHSAPVGNETTPVVARGQHDLVGFYGGREPEIEVVPAPRRRDWMDAMPKRWANRCLPMVLANEAGWVLLNPYAFRATWSGELGVEGLRIEFDRGRPAKPLVLSLFGSGILTWRVPYLFRTGSEYNLLVRGPANSPKDGICALEGLVEADWSIATFTMNWKLTRPGHEVSFDEGEPFCMVVPQRRGELELFDPDLRALTSEPALAEAAADWARSRKRLAARKSLAAFSAELALSDREGWEGNYYRGLLPDGTAAPEHQKHLRLREFRVR